MTLSIAFAGIYDPLDPASWSGIPSRMIEGFEAAGLLVEPVGPLRRPCDLAWRLAVRGYRLAAHRILLPDREPSVARSYARQADRAVEELSVDAVVSPGVLPAAQMSVDLPIIIWTDATFRSMHGYYSGFSHLSRRTSAHAEQLEYSALGRCAAAVFASGWAARSAVVDYGMVPERVHEVPLGANLDPAFSEREVRTLIRQRSGASCRLLIVGVDWLRKGVDQAVAVTRLLNEGGLETHLTVVGCHPPRGRRLPSCVDVRGFVPRGSSARDGDLARLFASADFFILPTRAEAFGVVFAEAGAFGVPSLAPRTGGLESVVRDGVNGWLLPSDAPPEDYAERILTGFSDRDTYFGLALSAYREYTERLNWRVSCARVADVVRAVVEGGSAGERP